MTRNNFFLYVKGEIKMKTFKNSVLNYKCVDGCGVGIYNATKEMRICPECGGKLKKIKPLNTRYHKKEREYES